MKMLYYKMYELKRNVHLNDCCAPIDTQPLKEQECRRCSNRVGTPERLVDVHLQQAQNASIHDSADLGNIILGHCLCLTVMHPRMKESSRLLNPQPKSEDSYCDMPPPCRQKRVRKDHVCLETLLLRVFTIEHLQVLELIVVEANGYRVIMRNHRRSNHSISSGLTPELSRHSSRAKCVFNGPLW